MLDDDVPSSVTARCLAKVDDGLELEFIAVARGPASIRRHAVGVVSLEDVDAWAPQMRPEASPTDRTGSDEGFLLRELIRTYGPYRARLIAAVDPASGQRIGWPRSKHILEGREPVREWMLRQHDAIAARPRVRLGEYDRITPDRTPSAVQRAERRERAYEIDPQVAIILAAFPDVTIREVRIRGRGGRPGWRPPTGSTYASSRMIKNDEPVAGIND